MRPLVLALLIWLTSCTSSTYQPPRRQEVTQQRKEWYSGGNLSNKNGIEWLGATPENRLATSADFIVSLNKPTNMEEFNQLKPKAINLEACITKALTPPPDIAKQKWVALQERPITEMAVLCMKLLGLLPKSNN